MPRKRSLPDVPEGFEVMRTDSGPVLVKRTTVYMSELQAEFFRVLAYVNNCKRNDLHQEMLNMYMDQYPDIKRIALENLKKQEQK